MALIKCRECGKEISDKALTCPNCGAPVVVNEFENNEVELSIEQDECPVDMIIEDTNYNEQVKNKTPKKKTIVVVIILALAVVFFNLNGIKAEYRGEYTFEGFGITENGQWNYYEVDEMGPLADNVSLVINRSGATFTINETEVTFEADSRYSVEKITTPKGVFEVFIHDKGADVSFVSSDKTEGFRYDFSR